MNSGISLLVILLHFIASSQCETIIILTSMNENCPGGLQCTTLQQYTITPSNDSEVILELQPGNHTLNSQLNVASIDNFMIIGNDSQVVCASDSDDSEISLISVRNVFITEVSFVGCDQNVLLRNGDSLELRNVEFHQNRANVIESVNSVVIKDSVFDTNTGMALTLTSIMNLTTIDGCVFSNNGRRGITAVSSDLEISRSTFHNNRGPEGGCIHAQSSTVTIRVSNFTQCISEGGRDGGAIYGQQVAFIIANTNFTDNQGYGGGAIAGISSSFNITSSNFIQNIGTQWGGAVKAYTGTSSLTLVDTNFISNIARKGGGVYTERLNSLIGCSFMNNNAMSDGGGLWVQTAQSIIIRNSDFVNNTNDERGGGMYIKTGSVVDNLSVSIIGSTFNDNIAGRGHGGGIYLSADGQYASLVATESSFRNNTATSSQESLSNSITIHGGAIYMSGDNSSISIDSSDFLMNCASGSGGGVYISGSVVVNSSNFTENSALLGQGGAIHSDSRGANVTFINSVFDHNSAPSCGVLDVNERFHIVEFRDCSFTHNTATGMEIGGGVCCISSASMSIINSNTSHNSASMNGGVLYINGGAVQIEHSNFVNNSVERYGGVAYTYIHAVSYNIIESAFHQNSAGIDGGVLYVGRRGSSVDIRESEFSDSSATERGGVISVIGSDLIVNTTDFYSNTASRGNIISACNSNVSIYNNTGQIQAHLSRDVCTYFDSVSSYNLIEPINRTSGFGQATCTNCDAFIILTSSENYCPGEFTGDPCITLQQYAGSPSFNANITIVLEPGNHTLTGELAASNSFNYTMIGSGAKIICSTSAEISLTSVQHVLITGVSIIGCDQNMLSKNGGSVEIRNAEFHQNRANVIESVNTLMIEDSVFDANTGMALTVTSIMNLTMIDGCVFSNNGRRGITAVSSDLEISRSTFHNNRGPEGGCIHVQSSTVAIRFSNFTQCTSEGGHNGGAIYGHQVTFKISNNLFTGNQGYQGGGISGASSSFNITSCVFFQNIGEHSGGALYADINTRSLILADTNFISNTAGSGGAIFAYRLDTLVCCDFINNTGETGDGGGLYLQTMMSITISYCNFWNNTNGEGGFGGAGASIFVRSNIDYVSVNVMGSSFVNNTALPGHGGGLYFKSNGQHASIIVTESSFRNNSANLHESAPHRSAINGGGIYITGSNGSIFISNSDLIMNSASISGGAIYATGSISITNCTLSHNRALMGEGGAIISDYQNSFVSLTQTIVSQNTAPSCGAISIQNFNHIVTLTDSSFTDNEGTSNSNGGGGVACFDSSVISTTTCNFLNNMANCHGGVFLIQFSSFRFENSYFHNNIALKDGGVVYSSTNFQNPSTIYQSSFIQNTAGRAGGVLFIESADEQLNISQSTFSDNNANSSGGVIHVNDSTVYINETNIFGNTADLGDAIRACDSVIMFPGSQFTEDTDSSSCTLYDGNIEHFRNFPHTQIDIAFDTNFTTFAALCPFEYDLETINTTPTTDISTFTEIITTTEIVTTTDVEIINATGNTDAVTASVSTESEQTSGTLNQETSTPKHLDTTTVMNTGTGFSMGAPVLSGAAVGGIVGCFALLLLVTVSVMFGYCFYRSLHKKSGKYSCTLTEKNQEFGMSFKNENIAEDQSEIDIIETQVNCSKENTEERIVLEGQKDDVKEFLLMKRSSSPESKQKDKCQDYRDEELKQDDEENTVKKWYSQSAKEESNQEHIYEAPRHKSVGSKPSIKLSNIQIRNHPDSGVNIKYHENVMLSVHATSAGARSLCYKWERNGEDIAHPKCSGVNTSTLFIEYFSPEHEGEYTCIVSDGEEFKSTSTKLKLDLQIIKRPQFPPSVKYGDYVVVFVSAVGDQESIRYSWKLNGKDINLATCTGTNTRILAIKSCSLEHQGIYTCIVSSIQGKVESDPAQLKLTMEFHSSMPANDFYLWLQLKGLQEDDLQVLKRENITASAFERLNSDMINYDGLITKLSIGGKIEVRRLLDEINAESIYNNAQNTATATLEEGSRKGSEVNISDLQLLKWYNKSGQEIRTRIIDSVCHKWKTIATLLSKDKNTVEVLGQRYSNDLSQCVRQVFQDCFIANKPAFGRYSQDWNGIIELLKDIEEEALAEEMMEWLQIYTETVQLHSL